MDQDINNYRGCIRGYFWTCQAHRVAVAGAILMVISREHFRDFQAVVEGYGIEAGAVDPGTGYRIIQDSDIADDVLWAIMVVNGANIEQKAQICDRLMPQIMAMSTISE